MSSIITAHPPLIIGRHVLRQRTLYSPEGVFVVPMYIYRDDCGDRWKIEITRDYVKYRKYYTDYAYGDAQTGLDHAIEHLYDILPTYIPFQCLNVGSSLWYQVKDTTTRSGLIQTARLDPLCALSQSTSA